MAKNLEADEKKQFKNRIETMSEKKTISKDLVGMTFPTVDVEWSDKDAMLYALGVGARPVDGLDFIYEAGDRKYYQLTPSSQVGEGSPG